MYLPVLTYLQLCNTSINYQGIMTMIDALFHITASGWISTIIVTVVYNIKNDIVVCT